MASDPLIGKKLGDYVIQELLGRGGMARVYKGYDSLLQRYAAVKVINSDLAIIDQIEYTERFRREARAIARLNHPNIVGVYQFGDYETTYYMAMAFIEGKDLRDILREHHLRGQRMTDADILNIVQGIGAALDYAHNRGVIHRDVKPSNIMIDVENRPILTDFGLALSASEGTMGDTFGSAHYIAPEQAVSSANAVAQSDLYSLGVCTYEMLSGKVPFDDPSAMAVALKHLQEPPPPLRVYLPDVTPEIEQVIAKILDKDPKQRYATGANFASALEQAFAAAKAHKVPRVVSTAPRIVDSPAPSSRASAGSASAPGSRSPMARSAVSTAANALPAPQPVKVGFSADDDTLEVPSGSKNKKTSQSLAKPVLRSQQRHLNLLPFMGMGAVLIVGLIAALLAASSQNGQPIALELTATKLAGRGSESGSYPTDAPTGSGTPFIIPPTITLRTIVVSGPTLVPGRTIPSATPTHTATPTVTATATATPLPPTSVWPTVRQTMRPTTAIAAAQTSTPRPTATAVSTRTPTSIPTRTREALPATATSTRPAILTGTPGAASATGTASAVPTRTATPTRASTADIRLVYNDEQLNLINVSDRVINIMDMVFVQNGREERRFTAAQWTARGAAAFSPDILPPRWCFQLGRLDIGLIEPLPACRFRSSYVVVASSRWFWIAQEEGETTFDVLLGNRRITTCSLSRGQCEFKLP